MSNQNVAGETAGTVWVVRPVDCAKCGPLEILTHPNYHPLAYKCESGDLYLQWAQPPRVDTLTGTAGNAVIDPANGKVKT